MYRIKWPLDITWQVVKSHARVIESKVVVDRVAVASRAAHTVRVLIVPGVCGLVRLVRMRGRGRARGERRDHKRKRKEKDDQPAPTIKVPRRAQPDAPPRRKNENKKRTKALHTPRKHKRQLFDIGFFYWLVWFFSLGGWAAGLRSGRLTHDQLCPA